MSRRNRNRKEFRLEDWQAPKGQTGYVKLPYAVMNSPAYLALSKQQTLLLTFAWKQHDKAVHRKDRTPNKPDIFPYDKYKSDPNLGVEQGDFYLNIGLLSAIGYYKPRDSAGLSRDIKVLIGVGFLESVFKYKPRAKTKKVYRVSGRWQKVTAEQIEQVKKESQPKRNRKAG